MQKSINAVIDYIKESNDDLIFYLKIKETTPICVENEIFKFRITTLVVKLKSLNITLRSTWLY